MRLVFETRADVLKVPRGPFLESGGGRQAYVLGGRPRHPAAHPGRGDERVRGGDRRRSEGGRAGARSPTWNSSTAPKPSWCGAREIRSMLARWKASPRSIAPAWSRPGRCATSRWRWRRGSSSPSPAPRAREDDVPQRRRACSTPSSRAATCSTALDVSPPLGQARCRASATRRSASSSRAST